MELVAFDASTLPELRAEFIRVVDDYLCYADGQDTEIDT